MDTKKSEDQKIDVSFESHPPIEQDLNGVTTLLKQTLLNYTDCLSLAKYLIELKDITQVIALESPDVENTSEDDEPDDDIYGVTSLVDLNVESANDSVHIEARKSLLEFLKKSCPALKKLIDDSRDVNKIALIVNERYINLPPQLSLPTLRDLTPHLDKLKYSHLVLVSKIQIKSKMADSKLPNKKSKSDRTSSDAEPLLFVNGEEEIISENSDSFVDIDVSTQCDENASWSLGSNVKYIPHRRIMLIDYKKWPMIMESLEKELRQ